MNVMQYDEWAVQVYMSDSGASLPNAYHIYSYRVRP